MVRLDLPGGRRICSQIHPVDAEEMATSTRWMPKTRPDQPGGGAKIWPDLPRGCRRYGGIYPVDVEDISRSTRWMPKSWPDLPGGANRWRLNISADLPDLCRTYGQIYPVKPCRSPVLVSGRQHSLRHACHPHRVSRSAGEERLRTRPYRRGQPVAVSQMFHMNDIFAAKSCRCRLLCILVGTQTKRDSKLGGKCRGDQYYMMMCSTNSLVDPDSIHGSHRSLCTWYMLSIYHRLQRKAELRPFYLSNSHLTRV